MIEQQSQVGRTLVSWRGLPGTGFGGRGFWTLNGPIDALLRWQQRASERTRLADLTDRDLKDVGLTRDQIRSEIEKPFWRP